jgi:predicted metalloprotease with PDZ domain
LNEWENPCETLEIFKQRAAVAAAILGAQAVQIQRGSGSTQSGGPGGKNGFAAALLLVPRAHLGLRDDDEGWPRNQLVVRGFDETSLAPSAGLKVGDRIIEMNGADVLREKQFVDSWLSWRVGEDVVVRFVRDGTAQSLQVRTIAN